MNENTINAKVQQQVPSRSYFTKDIEASIRDMSEEEMLNELISFEQTRAWVALLKYNQIRLAFAQATVFSTDPVKDPTAISRNQGTMLGLCDLQNAVIVLLEEKEKNAAESDPVD